jgi:hypothetical protein
MTPLNGHDPDHSAPKFPETTGSTAANTTQWLESIFEEVTGKNETYFLLQGLLAMSHSAPDRRLLGFLVKVARSDRPALTSLLEEAGFVRAPSGRIDLASVPLGDTGSLGEPKGEDGGLRRSEFYLVARRICEVGGIEWRYPVPTVGERLDAAQGGLVIRSSPVETGPNAMDFAVVTRDLGASSPTRYVTHVFSRYHGSYFWGDYTNQATKAMENHNAKIEAEHRADLAGAHEELPGPRKVPS